MPVVNILIPGAPKAGTTSITSILCRHKDIFLPSLKEPRFFIAEQIKNLSGEDPLKKYLENSSILDWDIYKGIYKGNAKFKIDSSVQYLYYCQESVPLIKQYLKDPYIIIILRDPIQRALSNYTFNKKSDGYNSLIESVEAELRGKKNHLNSFFHNYKQGLYYEQVKCFLENFTNVMVLFYEDFKNDNLSFINNILGKLGLDPFEKIPELPKLNTSSELNIIGKILIGKYSLYNLMNKILLPFFLSRGDRFKLRLKLSARFAKKDSSKIILTQEEYKFLFDLYKEDILKLKELLKIDSLPWKSFKNISNRDW
jgi:hypothetical protein